MLLCRRLPSSCLAPARSLWNKQPSRWASILSALNSSPVLISSNKDVYTNLALEHWLYTNIRFNKDDQAETTFTRPIVLIWTDEPSLVMGRHQNPWIEANLGLANKLGIKLARRHSGGGCVYHDENNINISIIGERKLFENRQDNLRLLARFLDEKYGVKCEPNKRHDLVHSATGFKMSGSAAKLGRDNSYHHFTLLVDTDKEILEAAIRQKPLDYIKTNSSVSTRSGVINLNELKPNLTVDQVISDLAQAYAKHYTDTKMKLPSRKTTKTEGDEEDKISMNNIKEDLTKWSWLYGMTPKFTLERKVNLMDRSGPMEAILKVQIDRGLFRSIEIECDEPAISAQANKFSKLLSTPFNYQDAMINVVKLLQDGPKDTDSIMGSEQLFATHLLKMIHESNF